MTLTELAILDKVAPEADELARWFSPREFGGSDGSSERRTAERMAVDARKGWLERRNVGQGAARPKWQYRITAKGVRAREAKRLSLQLGG